MFTFKAMMLWCKGQSLKPSAGRHFFILILLCGGSSKKGNCLPAFGEDQIGHPLKAQPWWDERGTRRREGTGEDLVCKVRLE